MTASCGPYRLDIHVLSVHSNNPLTGILTSLEDEKSNGFVLNGKPESIEDWQGGLLQTAFIGSYMLLSPLFGYLGDRYTRKYVMSVGIFLWSAFTLVGSFSVVSAPSVLHITGVRLYTCTR